MSNINIIYAGMPGGWEIALIALVILLIFKYGWITKISLSNHNLADLVEEVDNFDSEYLYLTSNETIEGIQLKNFNNFNKKFIMK